MSKIPRNLSAKKLINNLGKWQYKISRKRGDHIRLTSNFMGYKHHITIPNHNPIKVGTLNAILKDIASYLKINKDDLL